VEPENPFLELLYVRRLHRLMGMPSDLAHKAQVRGAGGRYISAGSAAAPKPEPARGLTPGEQVDKLARDLEGKYPHTKFDFAGLSVESAQRVAAHVDVLFGRYPEVGHTVPYVGTGTEQGPYAERFTTTFKGVDTAAQVYMRGGKTFASTPMYLNRDVLGSPQRADLSAKNSSEDAWHPPDCRTFEFFVTHEFGHAVHNYLGRNGELASMFSWGVGPKGEGKVNALVDAFVKGNFKLGEDVSRYARSVGNSNAGNGGQEQFAEAFASLHHTKPGNQADYTRKLGAFLDAVMPGGKTDAWHSTLDPRKDYKPKKPIDLTSKSNAKKYQDYLDWVKRYIS